MSEIIYLKTPLWVFRDISEIAETEQNLLLIAQKACEKAYSPYSNFCVGAAILLNNREIVEGVNQENAAYPSGLCAERVAFFNAGVTYPQEEILLIAVAARKKEDNIFLPVSPCGACRQVMGEFEDKQQKSIGMIFQGEGTQIYKINSVSDLLPLRFSRKTLQ